jgi:hypothetical protein
LSIPGENEAVIKVPSYSERQFAAPYAAVNYSGHAQMDLELV